MSTIRNNIYIEGNEKTLENIISKLRFTGPEYNLRVLLLKNMRLSKKSNRELSKLTLKNIARFEQLKKETLDAIQSSRKNNM